MAAEEALPLTDDDGLDRRAVFDLGRNFGQRKDVVPVDVQERLDLMRDILLPELQADFQPQNPDIELPDLSYLGLQPGQAVALPRSQMNAEVLPYQYASYERALAFLRHRNASITDFDVYIWNAVERSLTGNGWRYDLVRDKLGADFGGGTGAIADRMLGMSDGPGGMVVIDAAEPMLRVGQAEMLSKGDRNRKTKWLHRALENLHDVPDGIFDFGVCGYVWDYLADPTVVLAEMSRTIKDGGHLILFFSNQANHDAKWKETGYDYPYRDGEQVVESVTGLVDPKTGQIIPMVKRYRLHTTTDREIRDSSFDIYNSEQPLCPDETRRSHKDIYDSAMKAGGRKVVIYHCINNRSKKIAA